MELHSIAEIFTWLDKSRAKLLSSLNELEAEQSDFRHAPENWSIANIGEHLVVMEHNLTIMIEKLLAKAEAQNTPSDGTIAPPVSFAEIAKKAQGLKIEAPEAMRPTGAMTLAESLEKLRESREKLIALRPRLEKVDLSNVHYPHPLFGKMDLNHWLAFIGVHEVHHLRQIGANLSAFGETRSKPSNEAQD